MAIAAVQAASWRTTYRGMLSDDYLDNKVDDELGETWSSIELSPQDVVLVAEDEPVVGFIAIWCRPDPFIDNLHVLPEKKSQGIGKKLMRAAAQELQRLGHSTVYLWVFESNKAAIGFYERLGGVRGQTENHDVFGHSVSNLKIEWPDISVIVGKADPSAIPRKP